MDVIRILDVSETNLEFEVQFKLTMLWYDPGLTFVNLKPNSKQNVLSQEQKERIWNPVVTFTNTAGTQETVNDDQTHARVERRGEFSNSKEEPQNAYIFKGADNPIEVRCSLGVRGEKRNCTKDISEPLT